MELVGSGFGDGVHDSTGLHPVTGGKTAGLYAELLQGVRKRKWEVNREMHIVRFAPIQKVFVPVVRATADRDPDGSRHIVTTDDPARRVRRDHGATGEKD